jgi:hypothetical protein
MASRFFGAGAVALLLAGCANGYGADRDSYYGRHDCHYYGDCDHGGYFR